MNSIIQERKAKKIFFLYNTKNKTIRNWFFRLLQQAFNIKYLRNISLQ